MWDVPFLSLVKDRDKPVPIDEFGAHVQRMHADRDRRFEQEYNVSRLQYTKYYTYKIHLALTTQQLYLVFRVGYCYCKIIVLVTIFLEH